MDCKIKSPALSSPSIQESASPFSFIPQPSPPPTDPTIEPRLQPIDYILNSGDTDSDATSLYSLPPISLRSSSDSAYREDDVTLICKSLFFLFYSRDLVNLCCMLMQITNGTIRSPVTCATHSPARQHDSSGARQPPSTTASSVQPAARGRVTRLAGRHTH
ncbi:hypothetical protein L1887_32689 [Cichorium endivia]|nr:hypothetical protein L1887_32689 [Cichorium endivia]